MRKLGTPLGVAGFFLLFCSSIAYVGFPKHWILELVVGVLGLLGLGYFFVLNKETVVRFFTGKSFKYGINAVVLVLFTLGIIVILNFLSVRHHKRFDTTELGLYSLSPQTIRFLENLSQDVTVTTFFRQGRDDAAKRRFEELANQYAYYTERITFNHIDPDQNIASVKSFGIEEYGSIVFQVWERVEGEQTEEPSEEKKIGQSRREGRKIINTEITQVGSFNQPDIVLANDAESEMTNALIAITQTRKPLITFLVGHGERDVDNNDPAGFSYIKKQLEDKSYEVDTRNLIVERHVPEEVDVIAIASPQTDLQPEELHLVKEFVHRGGSLFLLLDTKPPRSLIDLALHYGVEVMDGMMVQLVPTIFGDQVIDPFVTEEGYSSHAITEGFNLNIQFPEATGLEQTESDSRTIEPIIVTGENSWLETNLSAGAEAPEFDEGEDTQGPFSIAMAVEQSLEGNGDAGASEERPSEARIVVFADSDFASNRFIGPGTGNKDLVLNVVGWLTEQEELIAISPKTAQARIIRLTPQQLSFIFWTTLVTLPMSILLVGLTIWWRRRHL